MIYGISENKNGSKSKELADSFTKYMEAFITDDSDGRSSGYKQYKQYGRKNFIWPLTNK